jgi:hypothetical protein
MTRFSTAARRVGVAAAVIGAAAFSTVATADAAPAAAPTAASSDVPTCYLNWLDDYTLRVDCNKAAGSQYRAAVRCNKNNWPDYNRYGAWKSVPDYSVARCNNGDKAFNGRAETR